MKFKLVSQYSAKTIHGHLATPSGKYIKDDGTELKYSDLHQVKDMYEQVLRGEYEFTGLKQNLTRELGYTNDGSDADSKKPLALEYRNNFDHIVIEGIPATADAVAIRDAIKDALNSLISYEAQKRDKDKVRVTHQMPAGERQIFTRIETAESGNKHIHILMNKRGFLTKEIIEKELEANKNNHLVVSKLKETLDKMTITKLDKALAQALNLQATYDQKLMGELINKTLISRGLSPIESFGSFTASADSNKKTTSEAKQAINEIINNDFDEETVNKVVEEIQKQEHSSVDSVIIQKRIAENKEKAEQLASELQKLSSESRQLEQAQKAINENYALKNNVEKLSSSIEQITKTIEEKDSYIQQLKDIHIDELDEINKDYRLKISSKNEELEQKKQELDKVNEEFETLWKDKENLEKELKEHIEKSNKKIDEISSNNEKLKENISSIEKEKETLVELNKSLNQNNESQKTIISTKDEIINSKNEIIRNKDTEFDKFREESNQRRIEFQKKIDILQEKNDEYQKEIEEFKKQRAIEHQKLIDETRAKFEFENKLKEIKEENTSLKSLVKSVGEKFAKVTDILSKLASKMTNEEKKEAAKVFENTDDVFKDNRNLLQKINDRRKAFEVNNNNNRKNTPKI